MSEKLKQHKITIDRIQELRSAIEPGFDDRESAESLLAFKDPCTSVHGNPCKVRNKPCHDCAVTGGLYTGVAACAYRHLSKDERQTIADGWTCHNGGRCEGAFLVLMLEAEGGESEQ